MSKNFAKLTENDTKRPKYTGKCQKYTGISESRRYMSKVDSIFSTFALYVSKKCSKMSKIRPLKARKWPKFDQKYWKLYGNYTGFFDCRHIFGLSVHVENVPKKLSFYFRENVPKFETVTGTHGLS